VCVGGTGLPPSAWQPRERGAAWVAIYLFTHYMSHVHEYLQTLQHHERARTVAEVRGGR
jgi:hypothetical protein